MQHLGHFSSNQFLSVKSNENPEISYYSGKRLDTECVNFTEFLQKDAYLV